MIDFEKTETAVKIQHFTGASDLKAISDYQLAIFVSRLVYQFPESIDQLKFVREWNEVKFLQVKRFYYCQFFGYLVY